MIPKTLAQQASELLQISEITGVKPVVEFGNGNYETGRYPDKSMPIEGGIEYKTEKELYDFLKEYARPIMSEIELGMVAQDRLKQYGFKIPIVITEELTDIGGGIDGVGVMAVPIEYGGPRIEFHPILLFTSEAMIIGIIDYFVAGQWEK